VWLRKFLNGLFVQQLKFVFLVVFFKPIRTNSATLVTPNDDKLYQMTCLTQYDKNFIVGRKNVPWWRPMQYVLNNNPLLQILRITNRVNLAGKYSKSKDRPIKNDRGVIFYTGPASKLNCLCSLFIEKAYTLHCLDKERKNHTFFCNTQCCLLLPIWPPSQQKIESKFIFTSLL
jgi:hypothetical protein